MPLPRTPARRLSVALALVAGGVLAAPAAAFAADGTGGTVAASRGLAGPDSGLFPGAQTPLGDTDARGRVAPLASARAGVRALRATASWSPFGTPSTVFRSDGFLATGVQGNSPAEVGRAFLRQHAAAFGLTTAQADGLEMWLDTPLPASEAHQILFRQHAGPYPLSGDGLLGVLVRGGDVALVSGAPVPDPTLNTTTPTLTAKQAVLRAVRNAGLPLTPAQLSAVPGKTDAAGFTLVSAKGLAQPQRTRLAALAIPGGGVRLAWETDVADVAGGLATATITYVDAVDGRILLRHDAVDTLLPGSAGVPSQRAVTFPQALAPVGAQAVPSGGTFMGSYTGAACSAPSTLVLPPGTRTIAVAAAAVSVPSDDITVKITVRHLSGADDTTIGDTGTSPDTATLTLGSPSVATDVATSSICPFDPTQTGGTFVASYGTSDQAGAVPSLPALPSAPAEVGAINAPPKFSFFQANPILGLTSVGLPAADNRTVGCGGQSTSPQTAVGAKPVEDCALYLNTAQNPTVYDTVQGFPTNQTSGNNAVTTNAQESTSLTPGPPATTFPSATRDYLPSFTDQWKASGCDPTSVVSPQQADINASIVNLFTGHNRIHDFAFRLGLTEPRGALQASNASGTGVSGDPELGNAQNAAATNAALAPASGSTSPTTGIGVTGRNNANQITMQDGVPGITNQYLFQPVVGFFGPCADGDLDSSIFLHEYTHAISNRLVGGPQNTLSGQQGGSMGESWSDLDAIEFLNAFGVAGKGGEDRYAEGAYATGDIQRGIRDYNLLDNPLTYGEFGFDTTGPEVHADGEIWNAIQMHVRQALIELWNGKGVAESDAPLQKACALGRYEDNTTAPDFEGCPGNRRWIHYLYDGMILQANGTPTFVDIKNNMLASAMMRNNGGVNSDDYRTMAGAFAQRGLGGGSSTTGPGDTDPKPGFDAPAPNTADNGAVTVSVLDDLSGAAVPAKVYVGTYSARATPVGTTTATAGTAVLPMVAGTYPLVVQAPGYGLTRSSVTVAAGQAVGAVVKVSRNLASAASGATITAPGSVRPGDLVDDSEATDSGFDTANGIAGKSWTVDLKGAKQVQRFNVSAMHRPTDTADSADFQSRLTDLRAFHIDASSDGGATYQTVYTSPADFFPAKRPRTVVPDVNLRSLTLPTVVSADHLRLVVNTNQCSGAPNFAGEQDMDPNNATDCPSTSNANRVTAAEFQAFGPAAAGTETTPPVVPESPVAVLLPLAAVGLAAMAFVARRRRRA